MELIRKAFALKALDEAGTGEAVFATLGVIDKDGDVIEPGAFGQQTVKVIPTHDWNSVPIGKAAVFERGKEAIAAFRLNLGIPLAKDWHSALLFDLDKGAPLQEWSFGFSIEDSGQGEQDGRSVRFLKALRVHEVSPVLLGAGINTRTLVVKGATKFADHVRETVAAVRTLAERAKAVADMRRKNGNAGLSADATDGLKGILADFAAVNAELDALLVEAPKAAPEAAPDALKLLGEFERIRSRLLGVGQPA